MAVRGVVRHPASARLGFIVKTRQQPFEACVAMRTNVTAHVQAVARIPRSFGPERADYGRDPPDPIREAE